MRSQSLRSATPNAMVFIDGRNVGPSPYVREDMPSGEYNITIRADGFDDRTERCTVSIQQGCELNLPLSRTVTPASLHVELTRAVAGAQVVLDGNTIGEVGAGRDVPRIPPGNHDLRISAPGFQDYVENLTLQEGEQHRFGGTGEGTQNSRPHPLVQVRLAHKLHKLRRGFRT